MYRILHGLAKSQTRLREVNFYRNDPSFNGSKLPVFFFSKLVYVMSLKNLSQSPDYNEIFRYFLLTV